MNAIVVSAVASLGLLGQVREVPSSNVIQDCYVRAIDEVDIPGTEAGVLKDIMVTEGQFVNVDDVLAKVDDIDAQLAKISAKNSYMSAKNGIDEGRISRDAAEKSAGVSQAEYDKALEANAETTGAFSETEVKRLKLQWERAVLQIQLADSQTTVATYQAMASKAEYDRADAQIDRRTLKSSVNGVVDQIHVDKGEWVSPQDKVMTIVRMDRLRVHGNVPADVYKRSEIHNRRVEIMVQLDGGGIKRVPATIGFASYKIDENNEYRIWAEVENTRDSSGLWELSPGMTATIELK